MPAACQSFLSHPSTFAFSGLEGAKQQRLCRPSGNPVGVNLAGVSLFRMRAHGWRWGLWRAFGMADAARFCSGPLRPPNQCLPLAKASCFNRPPLLLVGAKVPNGPGSADLVATRWAWILLGFPCFGCVLTGDAGGCDVPLERLMPTVLLRAVTFAQPMPAACQSSLLHPSTFAFRGFEGAKRQRLCQPSGNPLGPNLAGVSLFGMRAHRWRWGLWRAFGMADAARFCWGPLRPPNQCLPDGAVTCLWNGWCRTVLLRAVTFVQPMPAACQSFVSHPSTFAFSGLEGAKQQRLCRPSGNPVGVNLAGVSLFRTCSRVTLGAVTCLWNGWCRTVLLRAVTSAQPMPAACQSFLLQPSTLALVGVKVPNGSGSADLVATRWAWILLGFPCFGCVLTGDAGGCDVPLERLMPHGAAQGRYVRPTNACCLPKLPASPVHLCF